MVCKMSGESLFEIRNVKKYFPIKGGIIPKAVEWVHAVDGVTFDIRRGETFGLVGESGCGKTTTGRLIIGLEKPDEGKIVFKEPNGRTYVINEISGRDRKYIASKIGVVFQDPHLSLNPRMRIKSIVREPLDIHGHTHTSKSEKDELVLKMLENVGLDASYANRYPYELSGGEKQRVAIARALIANPEFILADEPVSSIDVSIRSQILNLMKDLISQFKLTCLFISHDLSVIEYISDRIGVMYLGKIVELAPVEAFKDALHPYSITLISAVPVPGKRSKKRIILKGAVPSAINPPPGCRFHTRCPFATPKCKKEEPKLIEVEKDHLIACHLYEQ
ncbi:hypothetical protein DRO69_09955 [Candidatus Bathyarchaeota archaeon]|nr:MAG: hypothetical protein DRO69_09955 [Candidatus Bathyarchaeota archaeon]